MPVSRVNSSAADKPSDPAQEESVAAQPPDATVSEPAEGTEEAAVEGLEQEIADVEAKVEEEEELSVEEQGRRIASQWTNDPEASGHAKAIPYSILATFGQYIRQPHTRARKSLIEHS